MSGHDAADPPSMQQFSELPESGGTISKDLVYTILSNVRRRYLLAALLDEPTPVDVSTLIDAVVVREYGEEYTYDQRKRVYVSLRQTHLPKLDESGVVDYDSDRGEVVLAEHFDTVTLPLRIVRNPIGILLPFSFDEGTSLSRIQWFQRNSPGSGGPSHPVAHTPRGLAHESVSHGFAAVLEFLRILL